MLNNLRSILPPQFARDRLRMHDLRLYVRDLLTEYAQLQRFDVKPSYHARCIDWERMLTEFEWPHYSKVTSVKGPGLTLPSTASHTSYALGNS